MVAKKHMEFDSKTQANKYIKWAKGMDKRITKGTAKKYGVNPSATYSVRKKANGAYIVIRKTK